MNLERVTANSSARRESKVCLPYKIEMPVLLRYHTGLVSADSSADQGEETQTVDYWLIGSVVTHF